MWYGKQKDILNYDKPIYCRKEGNPNLYILLPQIEQDSYCIEGYNWFSLTEGEYNSCCFFKTAQEAVEERQNTYGYAVFNGTTPTAEKAILGGL